MIIVEHTNAMASICPVDKKESCHYTLAFGKTFVRDHTDLNSDKLNDYIIKDFTGSYGLNDVIHMMLFAQCKDKSYVKVGDDFLTDVRLGKFNKKTGWFNLDVTRACYAEQAADTRTRRYVMKFNSSTMKYGPPNNDAGLATACSSKELASPYTKPAQ